MTVTMVMLFTASCRKKPGINLSPTQSLTPQEISLSQHFDQITNIVRKIYNNPKIRKEVSLAVLSNYYVDEVIKLKDILHPGQSPVFKTKRMEASLTKHQLSNDLFSKAFFKELKIGHYPGLKNFLNNNCAFKVEQIVNSANSSRTGGIAVRPPWDGGPDGGGELPTLPPDITIYFPYAENYADDPGAAVSVISAHGELDGDYGTDPYGNSVWIDDDYANLHPTQIIGMNGGDFLPPFADGNPNPPQIPAASQDTIHEVFVGFVKCTKQYDHFISLSGNGGGSEIRLCRGSVYLALDTTKHVSNGSFDQVSVYFRRKDIRKGRKHNYFKKVFTVWDTNWQWQNFEQVFAIYEEDTDPQIDLQIGLTTTVNVAGQDLTIEPFEFHYSVKTKDQIIRNFKRRYDEFFVNNKIDQGFGFKSDGSSSGLHGPWTIYDGGANVSYTMPEQVTVY